MASKAEIAEEQDYFDRAAEAREQAVAGAVHAPDAAAHPGAAADLRAYAKKHQQAFGAADSAVATGRMDQAGERPLYIGRRLIRDEHGEILVINWKLPAAEPFYRASHRDPLGLVRKRTYRCTGNTVDDFDEVVFAQHPSDPSDRSGSSGPDAGLLHELARGRTGTMRDIVATIQAAQFDLISAPLERRLVIEGGPGTGKTAVALHRVSWLLFQHRDRLAGADVLVVGPNPTFTRYIGTVLPSLGDEDVAQRDITQLAPEVRPGRAEPAAVSRLKGQARMAGLLARALNARPGAPEPAERLQIGGRIVTVPGAEIAAVIAALRADPGPYAPRRTRLRDGIARLVEQRGVTPAQSGQAALDNLVERLWPQLSAAAFLRDLLGSRTRLLAAAGDEFTAGETVLLRRRSADRLSEQIWSRDDLPLLDEAEYLINGTPAQRYAHIVVDEAQDLSPMQLRSIARRSATGSFTLLGDLAQSTGPWARDSWDDVTDQLPGAFPVTVERLRYGYRVPRQVYELAARLLPVAAPWSTPAEVVRIGPADPGIHRVDPAERAGTAVAIALAHAEERRFVGIVCPATCRTDVERALAANGVAWSSADRGELGSAINLVSPQESKGLEFDAVVVIEPEDIVAGDDRGHRLLYVALTRTVGYLDIVCAGEPVPLSAKARLPRGGGSRPMPPLPDPALARLATELATRLRQQCPPEQWEDVLHGAAQLLGPPDRPAGRHHRGG